MIAPSGRRAYLPLDGKIAIYSRAVLNALMLDRARQAGAEILHARVISIEGHAGNWRLATPAACLEAAYVIIAAGARSRFRAQFTRPFTPSDLMATAGYYLPGDSGRMQVKFLSGLEGYIWVFPRCDHLAAGICGKMDGVSTAELRALLERFLVEEGYGFAGGKFYSHLLPAPRRTTLLGSTFSGKGWAIVGDAAGFVDPITGEGLYYAFRSAELLSQALLAGRPGEYVRTVRQDFLSELATAAHFADRFYRGTFLRGAVIERMVQMAAASAHFRTLLSQALLGTQGYIGLQTRVYRSLPSVLLDFVRNRAPGTERLKRGDFPDQVSDSSSSKSWLSGPN